MSAIHHDTSSDLKVVGNKLRDILQVTMLNINMLVCLHIYIMFIFFS